MTQPTWSGRAEVDIRDSQPDWTPFVQPKAPDGAPNVLVIVWDDVGYGAMDVFGGPIETPTMGRIADAGLRYSNFHTTALCSPTRSSLLNGRNATSNNMACITEASAGFPGFSARIPFENGTIAEVLNERGWNTYAVGKWHLTPGDEVDLSSWRARWPLGRGFERFYGFLGGETNQWYPDLVYDNHRVEPPYSPEEGYHLSADLADKVIEFVRDSKAVAPDKPWYMYFCPGCGHAPHHVFPEWSQRYRGRFDQGYEAIRAEILANQKQLGLLPEDTELSRINPHGEPDTTGPLGQPWPGLDFVRPWDSLTDAERRLFVRMAENFAGFVSYTDHQIGRLLDYLEESGQLENTLIIATSDNGSSGEGGPNGSVNENKFFNNVPDTVQANLARLDDIGGPSTYPHYTTGWAWAFDTPFSVLEAFRGIRGRSRRSAAGLLARAPAYWRRGPRTVLARGRRRPHHLRPARRGPTSGAQGVHAEPDRGRQLRRIVHRPRGAGPRHAVLLDARDASPVPRGLAGQHPAPAAVRMGNFDHDVWELYDLRTDRTQTRNVADQHPELLERLKGLWFYYAGIYKGLPLDDRTPLEILTSPRPEPSEPRNRYVYYPEEAEVPESVAVNIRRRSYTIAAAVVIDTPEAEGVLFAHGGVGGGHALFIKDGRLHYVYNWLGDNIQTVVGEQPLPTGKHVLTAEFRKTGDDPTTGSAIGTLTLYVDADQLGQAQITTQPGVFTLSGDGLYVGRDSGSPVTPDYTAPFPFTGGTIERVVVDVSGDPYIDHEKEVLAYLTRD